jgi:hypothetical protein
MGARSRQLARAGYRPPIVVAVVVIEWRWMTVALLTG